MTSYGLYIKESRRRLAKLDIIEYGGKAMVAKRPVHKNEHLAIEPVIY